MQVSYEHSQLCTHHSALLYSVILMEPSDKLTASRSSETCDSLCTHTILYFSAALFYSHHTDTHSKSSESCANLCIRHSLYLSTVWFCCRDPMNSHSRSSESCANLCRHHSVFLHGVILYSSYPINTLSCAHTILHFSTALFFCSHLTNTDRSSESCANLCTRHSRKRWYLTSTLWMQ